MPRRDTSNQTLVQRAEAYRTLANTEDLISAARRRNDVKTVPQTRLYYQKLAAGLNPQRPRAACREARVGDEIPRWMRRRPREGDDPRVKAELRRKAEEREDEALREAYLRDMEMEMEVEVEAEAEVKIEREAGGESEAEGAAEERDEGMEGLEGDEEDGGVRVDAGVEVGEATGSSIATSLVGSQGSSRGVGDSLRGKRKRSGRRG